MELKTPACGPNGEPKLLVNQNNLEAVFLDGTMWRYDITSIISICDPVLGCDRRVTELENIFEQCAPVSMVQAMVSVLRVGSEVVKIDIYGNLHVNNISVCALPIDYAELFSALIVTVIPGNSLQQRRNEVMYRIVIMFGDSSMMAVDVQENYTCNANVYINAIPLARLPIYISHGTNIFYLVKTTSTRTYMAQIDTSLMQLVDENQMQLPKYSHSYAGVFDMKIHDGVILMAGFDAICAWKLGDSIYLWRHTWPTCKVLKMSVNSFGVSALVNVECSRNAVSRMFRFDVVGQLCGKFHRYQQHIQCANQS